MKNLRILAISSCCFAGSSLLLRGLKLLRVLLRGVKLGFWFSGDWALSGRFAVSSVVGQSADDQSSGRRLGIPVRVFRHFRGQNFSPLA
jgi:hypothetical protein